MPPSKLNRKEKKQGKPKELRFKMVNRFLLLADISVDEAMVCTYGQGEAVPKMGTWIIREQRKSRHEQNVCMCLFFSAFS